MKAVPTPVHGGLDPAELRELGLDPASVIDFSASVNPLGTPPEVRRAIAAVDPAQYPDRECSALRQALADWLGLPAQAILVGNGSTELIHLVTRARLSPGDTALVFEPTFAEYEAAALGAGATVERFLAGEADGFQWRVAEALTAIQRSRPRVVFLCNPNNPTGVHLDRESVQHLAKIVGSGGLLLIDEAYLSFVEQPWDSTPLLALGNVALLRSMTKDHGLAGLRLGYLLASPGLVEQTRRLQPSWSVNALAQAAGIAALGCQGHVAAGREAVRQGKAFLYRELARLGLAPLPSAANFFLVKVGNAAKVRRRLLERGLCVRDCASFGLPEHIRVAVRMSEDCRRLVAGLREALADG